MMAHRAPELPSSLRVVEGVLVERPLPSPDAGDYRALRSAPEPALLVLEVRRSRATMLLALAAAPAAALCILAGVGMIAVAHVTEPDLVLAFSLMGVFELLFGLLMTYLTVQMATRRTRVRVADGWLITTQGPLPPRSRADVRCDDVRAFYVELSETASRRGHRHTRWSVLADADANRRHHVAGGFPEEDSARALARVLAAQLGVPMSTGTA